MKKIDALLKKVEVFEKLAVYGDRKSFLKTLAQDIQSFPAGSAQGVNAPYMPGTAPSVNNLPEAAPVSNSVTAPVAPAAKPAKEPAKFDPRVKAVQSFINRQLVPAGIISPIDEDGKWGPETAGALKTWGDKNKLAGVPLSAVFTAAQSRMSVQPTLDAINPGPNATA